MTVVATVISSCYIAVATDSLLTDKLTGEPVESERSKIVRIPKFRAAACYWGLASYGDQWSTYDWLRNQAKKANRFATLVEFAQSLRDDLEAILEGLRFRKPLDKGIGIHLTGYEYIDVYWIPELFLCSNFADPTYRELCCLHITRETYKTASGKAHRHLTIEEFSDTRCRKAVHNYLHRANGLLVYNNGDPEMFNPIAGAIFKSADTLARRGLFRGPGDIEVHRSLVRRPVEIVSDMQHDFCRENTRKVGGRPHDLVITPQGEYSSSSGD